MNMRQAAAQVVAGVVLTVGGVILAPGQQTVPQVVVWALAVNVSVAATIAAASGTH